MYKNLSTITRTKKTYYLVAGFLIFCTIAVITLLVKYFHKRRPSERERLSRIKHFTKLLKTYLLNQNINVDNVDRTVATFKNGRLFLDYEWTRDKEFYKMLSRPCMQILTAVVRSDHEYHKDTEIWKKIGEIIETIGSTIGTEKLYQKCPIGRNWFPFSITLPTFVVMADCFYFEQFGEFNSQIHGWMQTMIPYLLPTPIDSLGWTRDGLNAIMMSIPWMGYNVLMNNFDILYTSEEFKIVMNYMVAKYVTEGEGYYADGGFVTHVNLRGYGYVYDSFDAAKLIVEFMKLDPKIIEYNMHIFSLLEHPEIDLGFAPLYTRNPNLKLRKKTGLGTYGFEIISSMRIVSICEPTYMLQFFAQHPKLYYYEADQDNRDTVYYATMARHYLFKGDENMLCKEFQTFYPNVISYKNTPIVLSPDEQTVTTQGFSPTRAESVVIKLNEECVAVYNMYEVPAIQFPVEEMMIITKDGFTASYYIDCDDDIADDIFVSINFGHYRENIESTSTIAHFKNTSSIIHTPHKIIYEERIREEDAKKYTSAQCRLGSKKFICFSTYVKDGPLGVNLTSRNLLLTPRYKLFYVDRQLYLIDTEKNMGAVGKHLDENPLVIQFESQSVKKHFGKNVVITSTSGRYDNENKRFVDVVNDTHNTFSKFKFVSKKPDNEYAAIVKANLLTGDNNN